MSSGNGFCLGWQAGSSAQIEVFSPENDGKGDAYRMKYSPPFRATLRPPVEELKLGAQELDPIRDSLNRVVAITDGRGNGAGGPGAANRILDQTTLIGSQLMDLILPPYVRADLRTAGKFLDIGLDEALLEYPWELMHDGDDFLCLKHFMGRFVNTTRPATPGQQRIEDPKAAKLTILLISVPQPQPRAASQGRPAVTYTQLPGAAAETMAVVEAFANLGTDVEVHLLKDADATYDRVYGEIKNNPYHIVHFSGHAYFNNQAPHMSSLVLFNRDLTTGAIRQFFASKPPILFFMNACETAVTAGSGPEWQSRYDIFGLARAFLETGAYLIGTRWQVGDQAAKTFAKTFYSQLLTGKSVGRAMRDARIDCRSVSDPDDSSWASYLLYGDPRLCFEQSQGQVTVTPPATPGGP